MTRDEIIRIATQASDKDKVHAYHWGYWRLSQEELERFAALVTADKDEKISQLEDMLLELRERT